MFEDIIICNKTKFEETILAFKEGGLNNVHVLSDFDKTFTYGFVNGIETPSMISILRRQNILGEEYSKKAYELYDHYRPIELDTGISLEEKKKEMTNWWQKHIELLIETGLYIDDVEKVICSGLIKLRDYSSDFIYSLNLLDIPLVFISANCLGYNTIEEFLKLNNAFFENIQIISNGFLWDNNGKAIGIGNNIIHICNKDETVLKEIPEVYDKIKGRKNVILLGDSIGDAAMIEGFEYDNLLKIAFLNKDAETKLDEYKKHFDIIILNNGDFSFVNQILDKIKS